MDFTLEFGPFDGNEPRMTVLLDPSLKRTLMFKKGLNPEIHEVRSSYAPIWFRGPR